MGQPLGRGNPLVARVGGQPDSRALRQMRAFLESGQMDPVRVEELPEARRPVTVCPTFRVQARGASSRNVRQLIVDEEQLLRR